MDDMNKIILAYEKVQECKKREREAQKALEYIEHQVKQAQKGLDFLLESKASERSGSSYSIISDIKSNYNKI